MKTNNKTILEKLSHLTSSFREKEFARKYAGDEPALRSELFSADQMQLHGKSLAQSHKLAPGRVPDRLLLRLAENQEVLLEVRTLLAEAVKEKRQITPSGEWLLDNFYLIEEQIRTAQRHLPKGYGRELPRLLNGPSPGLPRVYVIALEAISHGDGRVDPEGLSSFVSAYQTVTPLKLGELWAVPIMLRLALIENLRRVASRIAASRFDRSHADYWADQMMEMAEKDPKSLILMIADMARSKQPMVSSFVAEFARRLQGQSSALALPLTWLEQQLSESGLTIEQMIQSENQQQAADQVSVSNSIGSLRFLGAMDWREFVETMSVVEQKLLEDPAGVYGTMDFATRDRYRHVVEKMAKNSRFSESAVADKAIQLARERAATKGSEDREAHVGFYLIDGGLAQLERETKVRLTAFESFQRMMYRRPALFYLGTIMLITAIVTGSLLLQAYAGAAEDWLLVLTGILSLVCVSQLAVALANRLTMALTAPHPLSRMDFSEHIPPELRTLIVVPTMLTSAQNIDDLTEALEVRFLANRDDNLHFSLLTDFRDTQTETLPEDEPLLRLARKRIEDLNKKHNRGKNDTFFLFHRPRRWNPEEQMWMGYERKRGKLGELNSYLRGGSKDGFSMIVGDTAILSNVKYVITLDTDTQLPRDSVWQLVGAMAHPLNRAQYDEDRLLVSKGYGIIQPRVAASLPGMNRSRYARLWGGERGIDPYTRAISDVYQDLFQEGSFIGKGIYDVDALERVLKGRFPENRILSHDLLEGCYARAGLLSDVQVYEEYPTRYSADVSRRHRWIRGDWQLVRWLFPGVPGAGSGAGRRKNPLSVLSRWKLFDNLRRSLVPAASTLLLLLGWTVLSPHWFWTVLVIGIILLSPLIASILELFQKSGDALLRQHLAAAGRSAGRHFAQAVFTVVCLPYETFFSLDAILRTIVRMTITHKHLLQWTPSNDPDRNRRTDLAGFLRSMWIAPFVAASASIYMMLSRPVALTAAAPVLALWFVSPAVAWWTSRPLQRRKANLTLDQTLFLRRISRKTWAFFETFVGAEDNWLPPDNYQEEPIAVIGHRTSPTNMGLTLLANLSAYDFGYLSASQFIERTSKAFRTMESMERFRGHFYNWYDTQSLKPLMPMYISSVDSGNLAGALLTLRPGLLALPDQKIPSPSLFDGLHDTLGVLIDEAKGSAPAQLAQFQTELESASLSPPATLTAARLSLDRLAALSAEVAGSPDIEPESSTKRWADALARQCRDAVDELTFLAPWLVLPGLPDRLREFPEIDEIPTLRELAGIEKKFLPAIERGIGADSPAPDTRRPWLDELRRLVTEASHRAWARIASIERLAGQAGDLSAMDYDFLYDKSRHLLTIGYNVAQRRQDSSYYDLLASEARLSSFVAIAQGQLPQESWFAMGRLLTIAGGEPILMSWGGSMFEYLMPLLVMPTYENTLLDQTYKAAVARQIAYGRELGLPWGMSESCYNSIDVQLICQYRAFGIPGLGLKHGLSEDFVIAPYASALALMVAPEEACLNLQRFSAEGVEGRYGFYEAVDYTPSRLPRGQSRAVIRSFMAHHEGMIFLSLAYLLLDRPMQRRFESDPIFQATTLLLQERIPKATALYAHVAGLTDMTAVSSSLETPIRVYDSPDTPIPELQLLSNGRYHVMITNAGGGYSRWKNVAVTRWREDTTCDNWGMFCYIRDVSSGEFWSTAFQPAMKNAESYEAIFSEARAEFRGRNHDLDMHTEIAVSPEDDIELRRITIINRSRTRKTIDVTSYAEVVLAPPAADELHPAFSNLFVQTEILRRQRAILCTRRPRSLSEPTPWMFHLMAVHDAETREVSYETDRTRFIGRGRTVANPQAMSDSAPLTDSEGAVLDPIVAIRCRITLDPEDSVTINCVTGIGETHDACLHLVEKYQDRRLADRVFDVAWTHSQVVLRQINATDADAQIYGRLASSIIYANSSLRAEPSIVLKNRRGQSGLWGYSISGDLPIVLLQITDPANIELVRQIVQAYAYWRLKGLAVDLVIWNEEHAGYRQLLHDQIVGLIAAGIEANVRDRPGGIFVRLAEQIPDEDKVLLQAVARAIITDSRGALSEQLSRRSLAKVNVPRLIPTRGYRPESSGGETVALPRPDLIYFNGLGGFTPDGREYIITTTHRQVTPAPWVNVLANPHFGTVISESGAAYTWVENAHEFRLTPWHNDPVSDTSGEAFYVRDEESGHFWSPTPLPCRGVLPYVIRHGFGYSIFEHTEDGIRTELKVYVAPDAPVKFMVLKVRNESGRTRRLSATGYAEWVLGDLRQRSAMHVITEVDLNSGALFARNTYNTEFGGRIAFFDVDDANRTVTGDRTEFIGRNGTLRNPAAMGRARLSGRVGAALDPCAALQVPFELDDGDEREIIFMLGAGQDAYDAGNLVYRFRGSPAAHGALEAVWHHWDRTLGTVNVDTPDPSVNVLTNGWLLYQTLACRLWARNGFYQPGGAIGFRDQLQDVMALIHAAPLLAREHLLLCAAHQFPQGDVQHWWHPPSRRGVRTHCSDDYLWLPLAAYRYVTCTGDTGVLDESVHFIEGRPVQADEDSYYDLAVRSEETASLYDHCVRALLRSLNFGEHGLPLIGSGDWNDGMNMVGEHGKGESVWLGFFLYDVLLRFAEIADPRGDSSFAERCRKEAARLQRSIEQSGWDGEWYLRAYFDDGTPLGSATNPECQIDSIPQSWSVLSGAGNAERSRTAMDAVDKRLVRRDSQLIQILDPPFDTSNLNPGYIKGYVPGVRENGGQYTHAAIWVTMAFAALNDSRRAWELLTMINPVNHANTPERIATYRVEPYVMAADIYARPPHTGRGGWTWYTGSAGWMYRLIVESILGMHLEIDKLRFTPCLPAAWESFKVHYRYRETVYHITVMHSRTAHDEISVEIDGIKQHDDAIPLVDDRQTHFVEVRIPAKK